MPEARPVATVTTVSVLSALGDYRITHKMCKRFRQNKLLTDMAWMSFVRDHDTRFVLQK